MNRKCEVCGENNKELVYTQEFNDSGICIMNSYDVVICRECGFVFADDIPSQKEFDDYYKHISKYEFNHNDGHINDGNKRYFDKVYRFIEPHLTNKKMPILDIGCSTGALLNVFKSNGYDNVTGLDPSKSCSISARNNFNIDVIQSDIFSYSDDHKYDLILLSAVLEHVPECVKLFDKVTELLNDGGLIFVEVPDLERFYEYIDESVPFQQFSTEHINYFSLKTLSRFASKFGLYEIDAVQGGNKISEIYDPDIFMLLHKNKLISKEKSTSYYDSKEAIYGYVDKSIEIDKGIKDTVESLLSGVDEFIVWGVGTFTLRNIGKSLDIDRIKFFVDSNQRLQGKNISGKAVVSPDKLKEFDEYPIYISTYAYTPEITDIIRNKLCLKNRIISLF